MTSGTRHVLSEAVLWLAIFTIALVGFFYLDDRLGAFLDQKATAAQEDVEQSTSKNTGQTSSDSQENTEYGRVVLHAGHNGHFKATAYINDSSIDLMVDTGASYIALTYEDAEALGLTENMDYTHTAKTANGTTRVALTKLDNVRIGDIEVSNLKAFIHEEGALFISLLGMNFIGRLESFKLSGRELTLVQ